ncbi:MAG: type II toxin-antitoxin system HicB family antitoxin [Pseudomonadota bacterium]
MPQETGILNGKTQRSKKNPGSKIEQAASPGLAPSKLEEIMADTDFVDAVAYLVVEIPDTKTRTVRVNITVPEMILKKIDAAAKKRGMSRSSFLVHAAQNAIQNSQSEAIV